MSPRLAPALGLAAACTMLTGVGVIAISLGHDKATPTTIAGAVLVPTSPARVTPSLAARQVTTSRAKKATPTPTTVTSAAATPAAPVQNFSSTVTTSNPGSTVDASSPVTTPSASTPVASSSPGFSGSGPALHATTGNDYESYAQAVFRAVNQARAAHHLPALAWSANLQVSAHRHNLTMARTNTLSHQVDGEPSLGERETAAGVQWTFAAENIGWTTDRSTGGALDIESRMYGETAPNDAHKRNILSTSATSIGVDVYIDAAHGRLWLTEDFSG